MTPRKHTGTLTTFASKNSGNTKTISTPESMTEFLNKQHENTFW